MLQKVKYLFSNLVCKSDKRRLSRLYCVHPQQATQSGHRGKTWQRIIILLLHAYTIFSLRKRVGKSVRVKGKSLCYQMSSIIDWLQVCDPGYL